MRTSPVTGSIGSSSARNREGILLIGSYDGVNRIFELPEIAAYDPPKRTVRLYHNGRRMMPGEYEIYESTPGSGYKMVKTMAFAPQSTSRLMADYTAA